MSTSYGNLHTGTGIHHQTNHSLFVGGSYFQNSQHSPTSPLSNAAAAAAATNSLVITNINPATYFEHTPSAHAPVRLFN